MRRMLQGDFGEQGKIMQKKYSTNLKLLRRFASYNYRRFDV